MHFLHEKMRNGFEPFPTCYRISPDTIVTEPTSCPVGTRLVHLIIYCCNIKAMQCHYNFNRFIISFTITSFSSGFDSAIINVIATNVLSFIVFYFLSSHLRFNIASCDKKCNERRVFFAIQYIFMYKKLIFL